MELGDKTRRIEKNNILAIEHSLSCWPSQSLEYMNDDVIQVQGDNGSTPIQITGKVAIDDEAINRNIEGLKRKGKPSYFAEAWVCCWD